MKAKTKKHCFGCKLYWDYYMKPHAGWCCKFGKLCDKAIGQCILTNSREGKDNTYEDK